ncbi:MAG: cysteine desulfurase NifS [Desulfobacterales bacterium]|nr:cysteine desulfurase NifS [Desulfobacterales bacterium]
MRRIYLDYNATTPVRPEVLEAMMPFLRESYGNPSSIHHFGQEAKKGIEVAREKLANLIRARPPEIVFTGGGTEADNLAIKGVAYANRSKGKHLITSSVEHHAVLHSCRHLEKDGFHVTYLPVDSHGRVNPDDMKRTFRRDTILVTIMHSNNEVGTLQPIETIGKIAQEQGVLFHTDSIQSIGKIPVDVERLGVDLLSISGHKFYGPKGVGALYVKDGVTIECQTHGGSHERQRRAGTENVAGIVGLGKAAELASMEIGETQENIRILRDYFWGCIQGHIDRVQLNGDPVQSLPNTLNVTFDSVQGESVVINLDLQGVSVSTGSACTSGALEASHVLMAMGMSPMAAQGSLRFSLGRWTTREEIDQTVGLLAKTVNRLRSVRPSPLDARGV